jgi:hypothetical protein
MLLNALEMMLFLIQRGGAQAKPRVAFPFLYLECLCFFPSSAVMVRAVRTEMCVAWKVVGPAHDHDEEQHHLQQQHFAPIAIATLLVAPKLILAAICVFLFLHPFTHSSKFLVSFVFYLPTF